MSRVVRQLKVDNQIDWAVLLKCLGVVRQLKVDNQIDWAVLLKYLG
jgi:hypothetical protein